MLHAPSAAARTRPGSAALTTVSPSLFGRQTVGQRPASAARPYAAPTSRPTTAPAPSIAQRDDSRAYVVLAASERPFTPAPALSLPTSALLAAPAALSLSRPATASLPLPTSPASASYLGLRGAARRRPASALLASRRERPASSSGERLVASRSHTELLRRSRALDASTADLWHVGSRPVSAHTPPPVGISPRGGGDSPPLLAARRSYSHAQLCSRRRAESTAATNAAYPSLYSPPPTAPAAVWAELDAAPDAAATYSPTLATAPGAAFSSASLAACACSSTALTAATRRDGWARRADPIDDAIRLLVPDATHRPAARVTRGAPALKTSRDHGASIAARRVSARAHAERVRAVASASPPPENTSLASERMAQAEAHAATKRAAEEARARARDATMRAAQRNAQQRSPSPPSQQRSPSPSQLQPSSPSQRPSSGRSALAEPVGPLAVASAAALDPHAKRLFSEPASRPAPRVLSDAEHRAELARIHGAEGSLARELADGDGREIEVMRAAGVAAGALRQLGAFRPFPDEALMRIVRMGRMQRRRRYAAIYHEGAMADGIFVLLSGCVLLQAGRDKHGGREVHPTAIFGLEALAALADGHEGGARLEAATAIRSCVAVHIGRDTLRSAVLELAASAPSYPFDPPAKFEVHTSLLSTPRRVCTLPLLIPTRVLC